MKTIIFLDDSPTRHIQFHKDKQSDDTLLYLTTNAFETIEVIKMVVAASDKVDELYLDHDLGYLISDNPIDTKPKEMNSKPVVDWIVSHMKPEQLPSIILHTFNFPAAEWMKSKLRTAGFNVVHKPFVCSFK